MPRPLVPQARALGLDLAGARSDRERAVRVHDFLRDRVRFGLTPWFDAAGPATTLRLGVGHCNPQGTLFTALLRELGIEARLHVVTLSNAVLRGLWPDGAGPPPELSHAFSEVRLGGRWLRVDSYIVDPALRRGARVALDEQGWELGYGMHGAGTDRWDGRGDAFSQFADPAMALEDHGPLDDLRRFLDDPAYRHCLGPLPLHQWLRPLRLLAGPAGRVLNRGVEATRRRGAGRHETSAPAPESKRRAPDPLAPERPAQG